MLCAPEATRPDSRTTLQYVHTTETWAPSRAAVSHTHTTLRMRNTMVVKGWSVGSPLYGGSRGSGGGCWVLLPKDDASSFLSRRTFSHALRGLCEGISLLSPCD